MGVGRFRDVAVDGARERECAYCRCVDGIEIDETLVRSLLREQHPDLAGLKLREVDGGWDNRMWRLGEDLAVRLPRTPRAPSLLRAEQHWLPSVTQGLPLPVPVPVRVGEPSELFAWTWTVTSWVDGEPADRVPVTDPLSADALAGFLRALHRPAPDEAPFNASRGVPLEVVQDNLYDWLPVLADGDFGGDLPSDKTAAAVTDVWEEAVAAPAWKGEPVWLHADLHPANVVVSGGALCGVIDFGELCAGDPAADLSAAWLVLPEGSTSRFFDAYGDADDATIRRARGWAALRALVLIGIGQAGERGRPGGKPTWKPAGWAALNRVLAAG
jgi:aminoglycoside phosphotransferase (APT) family kinase protein